MSSKFAKGESVVDVEKFEDSGLVENWLSFFRFGSGDGTGLENGKKENCCERVKVCRFFINFGLFRDFSPRNSIF